MPKTQRNMRVRNLPKPPKTREAQQNFYDNSVKEGDKAKYERFNHRKKEEELIN